MEGHCSTGQGPRWAVVPMEEEEEDEEEEEILNAVKWFFHITCIVLGIRTKQQTSAYP